MTNESEIQVGGAVLATIYQRNGEGSVIDAGGLVTTFGGSVARQTFVGVVVPGGDPERGTVLVKCEKSSDADFQRGQVYSVYAQNVAPL